MIQRILFLISFFFTAGNAQVEIRKSSAFDLPEFYLDALSFSSSDSSVSRVDFYLQIPYDALQFVKDGNSFLAQYEVTINLLTLENHSIMEKLWTEEIRVTDAKITESKKAFHTTQRYLLVTPGIYNARAQLKDGETKKVSTIIRKIIVGNYAMKAISISDIMLVNSVQTAGDKHNISPNVTGNIAENNNAFYLFYEIYNARLNDSIQVRYTISDMKGNKVVERDQFYISKVNRSQIIARFDSIPYAIGNYQITVEISSLNSKENATAVKQKAFAVRLANSPASITDIDLAIRQLRYIAKESDYDYIQEGKTGEEKRKRFEAFWKKRDPSPDTKRNEAMEEYYSRVEYANKNFSHYMEGWKTDMGMVFILFGSPNNVERHPFDIDSKPYEIWAYYDYNRSLVFVDESGFGDYRLLTPIWDLLQRLKN